MSLTFKCIISLLALAFCILVCNAQAIESSGPYPLDDFADSYISKYIEHEQHTSVALAIVKDGEIVFSKGYGKANLEENTGVSARESIFRIGSISKSFTCTAVLQLWEKGLIDLHEDVNTYLNDVKVPNTFPEPITIHDIMTHTSGFEESFFGHMLVGNVDEIMPLGEALEKHMPKRVNPPGEHPSYSNYAVSLLGLVIENVSGEPFEQYMFEHVLSPLKMENSSFEQPLPQKLSKKMAHSYKNLGGNLVPREFTLMTNYAPAGGMSTTANDMAQFILFQLGNADSNSGDKILQSQTMDLMQNRQYGVHVLLPGLNYGFMQENVNGHLIFGHSGQTPYYISDLVIDPMNKVGIFIASTGLNSHDLVSDFAPEFYEKFIPSKKNHFSVLNMDSKTFSESLVGYSGQYFNWWGNFSQIEKLNHLIEGITIKSLDENTLLISGLSTDNSVEEYTRVDKHLFRKIGGNGLITFRENAEGEITKMFDSYDTTQTYEKGSFYFFNTFNIPLVVGSFVIFLLTLLQQVYFRSKGLKAQKSIKTIRLLATTNALVNMGIALGGAIFGFFFGVQLMYAVPWTFYVLLTLPLISCVLVVFLLAHIPAMWRKNFLSNQSKLFYAANTIAGLCMIWFYYFWNILGFKFS